MTHIWILWTVISLHSRNYVQAYATRDACEHTAALMNIIADRSYDWVCLPAIPFNGERR